MSARSDARWRYRVTVDVLTVVAAVVVVAVLSAAPAVRALLPEVDPVLPAAAIPTVIQVLTLAAAVTGAGGAILAVGAARLLGDPRLAWMGAAFVLYCAVVLPWSTVAAADLGAPAQAARITVYVTALVLLGVAVRPPRRLGDGAAWSVLAVGVAAALLLLLVAPPDVVPGWLVAGPWLTVVVLAGWAAVATAVAADGLRRRSGPRLRTALGLTVLVGAQLYRVTSGGAPGVADLPFAALRLLGLVVVLVGIAQLAAHALGHLAAERFAQQEELAVAAVHMERAAEIAAERDHELRNGLAGLAGITHLLGAESRDDPDHDRIRHAVLTELGRLHQLLDTGGPLAAGDPDGPPAEEGTPAPAGAETPAAAAAAVPGTARSGVVAAGSARSEATAAGAGPSDAPRSDAAADPVVSGPAGSGPAGSGAAASGAAGRGVSYAVTPVLDSLVSLRRGRILLDAPDDLWAGGDAAVLAQIVTNLLANCARHAPGAPVLVSAREVDGTVLVQVRDTGPGLPPGMEADVLRRGVRDPAAGGTGLGLDITRRLVTLQGGTLDVGTVDDPRGCLASVRLPAARSAARIPG